MAKPRNTDYLAELKHEARALRKIADRAALGRLVPSRPGTAVADLLVELVRLYRWAGAALAAGATEEDVPEPPAPSLAEDELPDAFDTSLEELLRAFESHPEHSPVWTWAPVPWNAEFWHRRVAVATALARWDAQTAVGTTTPLSAALAAEAVSEVFEAFIPVGIRRGPHPESGGLVQLFAQDAEATWFVRLRDGLVSLLEDPEPHADLRARAAGSASDIALALWGRLPFGICDVAGEESLLQSLRVR